MDLDKIVSDTKNELDITYNDLELANKAQGNVKRGITFLNNIAGEEMEYKEESIERGLLYDYTRYAMEGMINEFEKNYQSNLLLLKLQKEAERSATEESI